MKNIFIMVIAVLGIASATLVSCDNGKFETTEVVYEGLDTTGLDAPFVITSPDPDRILVKEGDNLWDLSMTKWDEPTWRSFFENNPFLSQPGRVRNENGRITVLIYPGEELDFEGINHLPVITRLKETKVTEFISNDGKVLPWWAWLLIGAFVAAWFTWATIEDLRTARLAQEAKKANPVTQGPPVKEGGLTAENVRANFQDWATRTGRRIGQIFDVNVYSDGRIVPIQYGDRRDRPAPLNGEDAFEVEILNAEGQVTGYKKSLAKCANDIRGGADGLPDYVRSVRKAVQPAVLNQQPATDQPATKETQPVKEQEKTEKKEDVEEKASAAEMMQNIITLLQKGGADSIEITIGKTSFKAGKLNVVEGAKENPKKDNAEQQ